MRDITYSDTEAPELVLCVATVTLKETAENCDNTFFTQRQRPHWINDYHELLLLFEKKVFFSVGEKKVTR